MKRYERQIMLPEIGIAGQQKLADAKVLIIGVGGLGCPVLQNLTAAGVGLIGIVDGDVVDESNLHRQLLYKPSDCGKSKVLVASEVVRTQNPEVKIISYPTDFTKQNCLSVASDYHLIVDCSDNIPTRYLINDTAVILGIPMVYASIHRFEGQLSVFNFQNGPTYRCLFPEDERLENIPDCNDSGVLGIVPNLLGAMQANEVLKILLGIGEIISGKLWLFNSLNNDIQIIEIQKNNEVKISCFFENNNVTSDTLFSNHNTLMIDIREEYEEPRLELEHIKNVPLSGLDVFLENVAKSQKIILLCQNGNRSALAVEYLLRKGFRQVYHLQNGIETLEKMNNDNR